MNYQYIVVNDLQTLNWAYSGELPVVLFGFIDVKVCIF